MVHAQGERHRLQVDSLHRLARAAGLDLDDIYDAGELAEARAHEGERVNVRMRAYDVVADLPKGDSVLWALLAEQDEAGFRELVHQAKREAFAQLEEWIGYGLASEDGKLHRIATGGLLGWTVEHQSARPVDDQTPGDPHLHVHVVIVNMARCEDGQWRAIANGGRDLHRHVRAFDGLFKARVRALAGERFGVRYERDVRTRAWNVVGIPEELRAHYSRRAAQVDAQAGAEASREEKMRISAETRHAKHDAGVIDLRAHWRQRAEDLGLDVDAMVAAAAPGPPGPDGTMAAAVPTAPGCRRRSRSPPRFSPPAASPPTRRSSAGRSCWPRWRTRARTVWATVCWRTWRTRCSRCRGTRGHCRTADRPSCRTPTATPPTTSSRPSRSSSTRPGPATPTAPPA
ncbi:MobF family relaxase [Streptomyces stramineus]